MNHHLKPEQATGTLLELTPETAGWRYLSFKVVRLEPGQTYEQTDDAQESALVPLSGKASVKAGEDSFRLERESVFASLPEVLYLPPKTLLHVTAETPFEFTLGGAPAEGRYPVRLFKPSEMRAEMRGGANALRQVNHVLGPSLPAERLILYEVYTPSGFWSGWPPHRHDGKLGSAYIEESYYYKVTPKKGHAVHRNYAEDFDETFIVKDGELVLVPRGYHPVGTPPGSNVYYLNYMAGEVTNEARAAPPVDDPDWAWMREDWSGKPLKLPLGS
jgi:5-deoxy-glucuronate isomerase